VIWQESGGNGDCTILFLHGLGATAAVWTDDIPRAGHNAHVEDPRAVLGLIEALLSAG
jgi:pimeloyl-ACP methyl ester carboxylesterase